jgi:predicted enzyme related to lactoylglutathione lyase
MPGVEFETGNLTLAVLEAEKFGLTFSNNKAPLAFQVDDVESAREQLEAQGVKFMADTMDSGVCHMAFFEDPDGNTLCLHNRYAPPGAVPPAAQ